MLYWTGNANHRHIATKHLTRVMDTDKPDFSFENIARAEGFWPCAGTDEAGRGPLAGPVVAAAVILDPGNIPDGLDDSKRLTRERREALFESVIATAHSVAFCSICAESIDRGDIRKASLDAMSRAVAALSLRPLKVLIDGRDVPPGLPCEGIALIQGDRRSQSIAAASIIAKTMRDRMMVRTGSKFPNYGFEAHKGYGSPVHISAIGLHGGSVRIHRFSFSPLRQHSFDF